MKSVMRKIRNCLLMLLLLVVASQVSAQELTISNNLVYDATLTPNIRLDIGLSPHWTMGLTTGFRHWPRGNLTQKKWRHLMLSPEVRYWADTLQTRHFFGINAMYSHFNADYTDMVIYKGVKDERRQGDLVGLGVFYGYSWHLGRRWTLEALAGVAVGYAWYDRFVINKQEDDWDPIGDGKSVFALPQLGLNIVYHIPLKSKEKRRFGITALENTNHFNQ